MKNIFLSTVSMTLLASQLAHAEPVKITILGIGDIYNFSDEKGGADSQGSTR